MTESNTNTSRAPSHSAYQVRNREEDKKSFWTRIGSAWQHKDGKGFNIQLDAMPIAGRIILRAETGKED